MPTNDRCLFIDGDSIAYIAGTRDSSEMCRDTVDTILHNTFNDTGIEPEACLLFIEEWRRGRKRPLFRKHLALTKPYKGNRDGKPKPEYYHAAKQHMTDRWGATICHTVESDDACVISQNRRGDAGLNDIIATQDKDLEQYPGVRYNYRKREAHTVTPSEARHFLSTQFITGDSGDNIPGIPGHGPAAARSILDGLFGKVDRDYGIAVAEAYALAGLAYSYMLEQMRLIYLLREFDEIYYPPVSQGEYEEMSPVVLEDDDGQ